LERVEYYYRKFLSFEKKLKQKKKSSEEISQRKVNITSEETEEEE